MNSDFELSHKQSKAWHRLEDDTTTEILYGGAAGGGKSLLGCIWHIYRRATYPGTRGLIGRSALKNLKESTLVTLFDACKKMGYESGKDYKYNAQTSIITWINGSVTVLKDLKYYPSDPDFASLGSTEYTDAFIDESTEIVLKAFDIVKSRIRYKLDVYNLVPKIYLTGNPQPGWVKERFVMDESGKQVALKPHQAFIPATVMDNPNKEFVETYRRQLEDMSSDYDRQRLLHGDWDAEREITSPFARFYNEKDHVAPTEHNVNKISYVLIDFNVNPFSCSIFNSWHDGTPHVHQVAEIEIKEGTTSAMANAIKTELGSALGLAKFGGDFKGFDKKIGKNNNNSLFKELAIELGINYNSQFKKAPNPYHNVSANDCNYFLKHFPDFKIGEHCVSSRRDLRTVQVNEYGNIIKSDRSQENQRADFLDNFRYLVNTFFKDAINNHKKFGRW